MSLTKKDYYNTGDIVVFEFKGQKKEGAVLRQRTINRKGRIRRLAQEVTGDAHSLDQRVIEISDLSGKGVYTVGVGDVIGMKVEGTRETARAAVDVKVNILEKRADIAADRREIASDNLGNVRIGDQIEVKYVGGYWQRREFAGIVKESGKVRFIENGKTRYAYPNCVRAISQPQTSN